MLYELKVIIHERTRQTFTFLPATVHMHAASVTRACIKALQHDVCLARPTAIAQ